MRKKTKQHIIYVVILILVVFGLLFYQNYTINETRLEMISQQAVLSQQIQNLQNQLNKELGILSETVGELNTSIEKKGEEIKSLSGDLDDVKEQSEEQVAALEDTISGLQVEFQDFSAIIEDSVKGVVSVQTNKGQGSGFIIDSNEGYIVTNDHVISGAAAAIVITHDGVRHPVVLVGSNSRADIAVLRVDVQDYPRLRFDDSDDVKVGEKAIAIGNAAGLDFTVTQGIISSTERTDDKNNQYLQIDVPINPGNSGGPLINTRGRVIGVNTLKLAGFESVGFALKSNYVSDIVNDIIG